MLRIRERTVSSSGPLSRRQKRAAKEAIIRILGYVSLNAYELAEDLGLDVELTKQLLQELIRAKRVRRNLDGRFTVHDPLSKWWRSKGS